MNEDIAKHLGKTADGKISAPYVTPKTYDPSLLVRVPRSENREKYGISSSDLPFIGYDSWNCYETSFLLNNGLPINVVTNIVYSSDSLYIVESKSLKLFLNSFNMMKLGQYSIVAVERFSKIVEESLSNLLETAVHVKVYDEKTYNPAVHYGNQHSDVIDQIPVNLLEFDSYVESPELLIQDFDHQFMSFKSNALRSNCKITNQPDWGDVYVQMEGNVVTKASLLKYIVSLREENHFHEEICEMIYARLWYKFKPRALTVACHYTRRGGIDINPVRFHEKYERFEIFDMSKLSMFSKTMRQ